MREKKPPQWQKFDIWMFFGALVGLIIAAGAYLFVRFVIFKDVAITGDVTQGDIISATATALGGLTIGGVAVMQYRKHKWAEYQVDYQARFAEQQAELAEHHAKLDENVRTGERLSKAIEHLGDTEEHIRIGAIYELVRLAEDSKRDREFIGQLFLRFVNNQSEKNKEDEGSLGQDVKTATYLLSYWTQYFGGLIARRINLSGICLASIDLEGAQFDEADFSDAFLDGVCLSNASLEGANFEDAELFFANFINSNLSEAKFSQASLREAYFSNANLKDSSFYRAYLILAHFDGAHLEDASFSWADISGADFTGAFFDEKTCFHGATINEHTKFDPGVREKYFPDFGKEKESGAED